MWWWWWRLLWTIVVTGWVVNLLALVYMLVYKGMAREAMRRGMRLRWVIGALLLYSILPYWLTFDLLYGIPQEEEDG